MENCVVRSYFQIDAVYEERFHTVSELSNPLHSLLKKGSSYVADFQTIIFDVWISFYKKEPIVAQNRNISQYHEEMITGLLGDDECNEWKEYTVHDELFSVLTTIVIAEGLLLQLESQSKGKQHEAIEKAEKRLQLLKEEQQKDHLTLLQKERLQIQQQSLERQIDFLKKQMDTLSNRTSTDIQVLGLVNTLTKSKENLFDAKQVIRHFSVDGGKRSSMPLKEQFIIAEEVAKESYIKKIAELTGRFKKIAMKKQKSKQKVTMERQEIALGQELARLLPMELANFVMPKSKLDFYRRFAEQQAFIFGQQGKETAGRGPIIICMDESSSMISMKAESKALCMALMSIAKKQRRDFAIIPFASHVGEVLIFPKGKATMNQLLQFAKGFLCGGTNYEKPLQQSLEILSSSQFNKADVLFVTDGSSFLSTEFVREYREVKRKRKFECTTIVLANVYNAVDRTVIEKFSDRIIQVENLFDAGDVFSIV